jgi:hypothetical protein
MAWIETILDYIMFTCGQLFSHKKTMGHEHIIYFDMTEGRAWFRWVSRRARMGQEEYIYLLLFSV